MKNLLFAALLISGTAVGQKRIDTLVYPNEKVIVETDSTATPTPGGRFMYNNFWENWFVGAGGGGQIYFGDEDAMKPVGKRITATYEAFIGKWIHPAIGLRFKIGGGLVKGYSTGTLPSVGHSLIVGTPDADGIYTQRWHQFYAEGDLMVDLSNAIWGYKRDRRYSIIPYVGVGADYAQNQPKHDGDRSAMAVVGLINRFRVARFVDVNLEIKNAIVNQNFDREQSDKYYESFLALTVGVSYRFGETDDRLFFRGGGGGRTSVQRNYTHIPNIPIPVKETSIIEKDTLIRQETIREVMVEKKLVLTHPIAIFFELNQSTINDRAKVNLAFVGDIIKSAEGSKFRLIGSADKATASPRYNQQLSTRRCNAVREYLVNVLQVDPSQLVNEPIGGIDRYKSDRVNRAVIISKE